MKYRPWYRQRYKCFFDVGLCVVVSILLYSDVNAHFVAPQIFVVGRGQPETNASTLNTSRDRHRCIPIHIELGVLCIFTKRELRWIKHAIVLHIAFNECALRQDLQRKYAIAFVNQMNFRATKATEEDSSVLATNHTCTHNHHTIGKSSISSMPSLVITIFSSIGNWPITRATSVG